MTRVFCGIIIAWKVRMKKFAKEFKKFITRGNVIDLAVGMIIGAAFTAIVAALVGNVFKPLINTVPMGGVEGLITMLVPKNSDGVTVAFGSAAIDLSKSVYIDWGALITAIINFLLTAVILFLIIKAINALRDGTHSYRSIKITKSQKAEFKAQGMNRRQMREYVRKQMQEQAEKAAAEAEANKPETIEHILCDIRELLKTLQPEQARPIIESVEKISQSNK